jgi:hypothetical protein
MKSIFVTVLAVCSVFALNAQDLRGLDKSPLDVAYYPDNFPHDRKDGQKALVKVVYSRPGKNDRELFGKLVPYGKVWRTGANENTEITFYQDATVAGKKIKKGTYSLFTIPEKDSWTVVFNSDTDHWGAYTYNEKNDVLRVTAQPQASGQEVENFTIQFSGNDGQNADMTLAWGNTMVKVPMKF